MSSDWRQRTLGEFIRLQRGHDLTASEQRPGNVPIMGSAGPNGTHDKALASGPGVVIGRSGASAGRAHYTEVDYWPHNTCLYVTDFLGNNPRFAYYLLQTLDLAAFNSGSAQPSLNRNFLYSIPLVIPGRYEQDGIVVLLQSLDDRIKLLRETSATLEAVAQTLFKSWFVDFDPVRAKMEGRAPEGMVEDTAALFPDGFQESELGQVPRGWSATSVYDISKVVYGAPFASKRFNSEQVGSPLIRIRDLKDEKPGVFTDEVHPKGYMTQPGDIVVGMDGEFRAYIWGGEPAWLNQRVCVFQPLPRVSHAFILFMIRPLLAAVEASETATTVIHLGKNDIDRFRVLRPTDDVLKSFNDVVTPLYEQIVQGKQMAAALVMLRDTLLPRLISGQLRLPEAMEVLKAA